MKFKGIIVGLGKIGVGYDLNNRTNILTHANALATHPAFMLCGGVDEKNDRRKILEDNYSVPTYSNIVDAVKDDPDIVVVATPTKTHREVLIEVLESCSPRVILCEKPLTTNLGDAEEVIQLAESAKVTVVVNYIRRFEPGAISVGERIHASRLGPHITGVARYSKGLVENGSHIVNLLEAWLGELVCVEMITLSGGRESPDQDPDLLLQFNRGEVTLLANRYSGYTLFEIDLLGSEGRMRYQRSGLEILWWDVEEDQYFSESRILAGKPEEIPNDLLRYQWHVYQHIEKFLSLPNYVLPCTSKDAVKTLEYLVPWLGVSNE